MRAAKGKGRLWAAPAAVLLLLVAGVVSPAAASLPAVTPPPEASAHAMALALHAEAPAGESEASPAAGGPASSGEAAAPAAAASPHFSLLGRVHQGLGVYPLERVPSDALCLSKTCVWGSNEKTSPSSRLEAELSRRLHRGYGFAYDGIASDPCEYDYKGLRVLKQGALGYVHYAYDDKSVLVETDASGVTLAKYDYGPDRLLSQTQQTEGRSFYLFDALGSVTDLSTASGTLRATYQYDAWGNDRATTGSSFNAFGFTGHERDGETGLYYFKARFYDPAVGRFITEDPVDGHADNPPSLHRYLYAYVNPTLYTDPDGRWPSLDDFVDFAKAAGTAIAQTQRQVVTAAAKGLAKATVGVADFATLGSVSAAQKQIATLQNTHGSLVDKLDAAGKVDTLSERAHVLTLGLSDAPDKVQHLKDLTGISAAQKAGTFFGDAYAEGDVNKALQATGDLSQSFVQMAGIAEGAARFGGASGTAASSESGAAEAVTAEETAGLATRAAESAPAAAAKVEASVTGESAAGAGVEVGDTILRRSAAAATDTPRGGQNLSDEARTGGPSGALFRSDELRRCQ